MTLGVKDYESESILGELVQHEDSSAAVSDDQTSDTVQLEKNCAKNPHTPSLDEDMASSKLLTDVTPKLSPGPTELSSRLSMEEEQELVDDGRETFLQRVPSYKAQSTLSPNGTTGENARRKISILSMDGGGMRGLIAARILAHLESLLQAKTGQAVKLSDYFDFMAGTSTGAILIVMLSTPDDRGEPLFTAQGCCQFYARNGRYIFQPKWYDPFRGSIRQLYRPKYSPRRFEKLLKQYLVRKGRSLTMRDTLTPFLVTSFDISQASPFIFVRQAALKNDSRNFRLWEVCRGTAAAPSYFRPASVTSMDGKVSATLIDGGAIQNNPALVAMTHVLGNNEEFPEATSLQDVLILSLGAGQSDEKHELQKAKKWGMTAWLRPLLNIMMDGSSDTIDYQLAAGFAGHHCPENYFRIQLSGLPNKTAYMDCTSKKNIHDLIQATDDLLQRKFVTRNIYGDKVTLDETHAERLSWFADQLIAQRKLRKENELLNSATRVSHPTLGPAARLASPLFSHMFQHHPEHIGPLDKAASFRF